MHDDEQSAHTSGGVPHAYRNAVFWRWAPEMPRQLRGAFLTLLYALGAAANTSGALKFRDGKPIRIQDIAKAIGSDEKDTRRYVNAGLAAGVLGVEGERRRGRPTLYVLILTPCPDWPAAVASLGASKPRPKEHKAPWQGAKFGGPTPEPEEAESSGDQPPNFGPDSSGDQPPNEFGGPTPEWFGGPTPEQPRDSHVLPQEVADVGGSLTDARGRASEEEIPQDSRQPELRPVPTPPVGRRARKEATANQPPLLVSVPTEHAKLRAAAGADPRLVRTAVEQLGHREALRLYGRHLVWQHAHDLITDSADPRTGS